MRGKLVLLVLIICGVVIGGGIIWQKLMEFLNAITASLTSTPSMEIGLAAGLGVTLFAILLIFLFVFLVIIIQFILSAPS
jgi:hypothetical protein